MDLRQRSGGGFGSGGATSSSSTSLKKKRRRKSNNTVAAGLGLVTLMVVVGGLVFLTTTSRSSPLAATSLRSPRKLSDDKEKIALERKFEKLQKELAQTKKDFAAKQQQPKQKTKEEEKQVKLFTYYKKSKIHEKQAIKAILKRQLLDKYGPDPHYVEITLSFDPDSNIAATSKNDTGTVLIQLAPVDQLPATVFWFLEQVNATLYDGASFHRNAGHVVQGGPTPNFESEGQNIMKKFVDAGLEGVPFQEYSPQFPHVKYTLGYAGRPGGPDFYISTKDNSRNHGPGGQDSYDDPSEADPCFAKVVKGFDVVDRMAKSDVQPGGYRRMKHYVSIRKMRLVSPSYAAASLAKNSSAKASA